MLSTRTALAHWFTFGLGALLALSSATGTAAPKLQVLQHWKIGGAGGWDYLTIDSAKQRLFISRATRIDVMDLKTGKVVGSIADTSGVHGVALAASLKRGF